ncbi:hypothetical protein MNBD_UNCLBAC01-523 [hydrothermal vent metagenome]|uniref:DUF192 domain-containing protein n=1 Tax=hydrothermal vent metagenome TaxID=652676 RepID=A0A3B1DYF5_9ZZZZ
MKILNKTKKNIIAEQATVADTFISRMVGLLAHKSLLSNEALIITQCNSIHMFFMSFAIDVIFVNKRDEVVGLIRNIKPFRLSPIFWKSSYAIEVSVGVIDLSKTELGDVLELGRK